MQTPVSAHPSNPGPFEAAPLSAAPSSASNDKLDYAYADMPGLVEAPMYQDFFQPTGRASQPPHLEIQTSWGAEEFSFDQEPTSAASVPPSSAVDLESVPPSAVEGAFEFPPSASTLDLQNGYLDYPVASQSAPALTPCSPESASATGGANFAGVRTPIDEAYGGWDRDASTPAASSSSPVASYGVQSPIMGEDDTMAHAKVLALQEGFRTYMAHAEKMGAIAGTNTEAAFEQFVKYVQTHSGMSFFGAGRGVGGMRVGCEHLPCKYCVTYLGRVFLLDNL